MPWKPDALAEWRNRLLGNTAFRQRLQRNPFSRPIARRRARDLFRVNAGFVQSQVLAACLELDLLDRLKGTPTTAVDLAEALELDEGRLTRLLEAAAELGLTERRRKRRWGLGPQGAVLTSDPGLQAMSLHHRAFYADLADPVALMRADGSPTQLGRFWAYAGHGRPDELGRDATQRYTQLMADSQRMVAEQVLGAFDFSGFRALLDVGGGSGTFLAEVGRHQPDLALALFDLPGVIDQARPTLDAAGVGERTVFHGGDFHADSLPQGHDLISLVRIVHDHDDDPAQALLGKVHQALPPEGTVLIAEPMLGRHDTGGTVGNYFRFYLMAMGSGRPRGPRTLKRMLRKAGFTRVRRHRTAIPTICSVLSARKAVRKA